MCVCNLITVLIVIKHLIQGKQVVFFVNVLVAELYVEVLTGMEKHY